MNRGLIILFVILAILWMLFGSWYQSRHCNCDTSKAAVVAPVSTTESKKSIFIADREKGYSTKLNDNLMFPIGSCAYNMPVADSLLGVFRTAVDHLNNNPQRLLVLTGLYSPQENMPCEGTKNVGEGRAQTVKSMLVDMGAPGDRIRVQSDRQEVYTISDEVVGGVAYNFLDGDASAVESRLKASNLTLYFETNARNINLSRDQQQYFEDLRYFISLRPDASFSVIGHTDDKGARNYNKRLSRKRAEFVRDYMISQGIPSKNLSTEGMGPDAPIDTNETDEGRAKNRRVEVTYQG